MNFARNRIFVKPSIPQNNRFVNNESNKKGKCFAFVIYYIPCADGRIIERRSLSGFLPCAGGTGGILKGKAFPSFLSCADSGQEGPAPPAMLPAHGRGRDCGPFLSPETPSLFRESFARTGGVSRNMRKSPCGTFFGLAAAIKTRISWTRIRALEKWTASSRTYSDSNPHAARTVRSIIVWVVPITIGFQYSEQGTKNSAPNPYLRVSTADREMSAAAFRPKKIPSGSFLHVW